jgi:mycothiol synthase
MTQLLMRRPDLEGLGPAPALPAGYVLRSAVPDDAPGLAVVLAKAFGDSSWDAARVMRELVDDPAVHETFVVLCGLTPVATASVQTQPENYPDTGVLHWVASDPEHRGKKLGAIVSTAVLREFVDMGLRSAVLATDDERLPAIKTYLSLGFEPVFVDESHRPRWVNVFATLGRQKT